MAGAGQCNNPQKVVANRTSPRMCLEQLEIRGDDGAAQAHRPPPPRSTPSASPLPRLPAIHAKTVLRPSRPPTRTYWSHRAVGAHFDAGVISSLNT